MKPNERKFNSSPHPQKGFSLIELMVAALVLTVGLMGGLMLVMTAVAGNNRSKMDSTATILSQMTAEVIASVPADSTASATVTDCNPVSTSATHTLDTIGSAGNGSGAPLTSGGAIDFTQATVTGYAMTFYTCQASTGDRHSLYDVRWNIKTLSANAKLVTIGAEISNLDTNEPIRFALPVSLRMIVGLN